MKEIKLGKTNLVAIVDDEDFEALSKYNWFVKNYYKAGSRYAVTALYFNKKKSVQVPMHRAILNAGPKDIVDHKNGDGLDNRKSNIRICTPLQNSQNYKKPKTNTSGYKGVSWHKPTKRWVVYVKRNKKNLNLGYYNDIQEAVRVYNEGALKEYGEFARLNVNGI